ncbi:MAG: hypothetical protein Tsb0019_08190 [Roseibium sp.]
MDLDLAAADGGEQGHGAAFLQVRFKAVAIGYRVGDHMRRHLGRRPGRHADHQISGPDTGGGEKSGHSAQDTKNANHDFP